MSQVMNGQSSSMGKCQVPGEIKYYWIGKYPGSVSLRKYELVYYILAGK